MRHALTEISTFIYSLAIPMSIVLFGSLVHATAQLKVARDKDEAFTAVDFTILFVIAAFSGTIIGTAASLFFQSDTLITLAAGIGAFLGMAGVNTFANAFLQVLISKLDNGSQHDNKD